MALTVDEDARLTELLGDLEPELAKLTEWERGFIKDQIDRHRQYGSKIFMSPKQWNIIRRIHDENVGSGDGPDQEEVR